MANGELTPETIEEFIAAQQALLPRMEPPVAPPSMRFIGPPATPVAPPSVPLPMGTPQRFMARSPPPQIDPLEDIRKQINAVQFKTAQEALDAATQFQAMRAYQRDLEAGKDPSRWLPLLFKKNPSVIPGMMRERRLAAPPSVFQGSNVPPAVVYGGRVAFPPASSLPRAALSSDVTEHTLPGSTNIFARSVQTGPQSRRVFPVEAPSMTPSQTATVLGQNIRAAEQALTALPTMLAGFVPDETIADKKEREKERKDRFDAAQAKRKAIQAEIDGWREQLKGMVPGVPAVGPNRSDTAPLTPTEADDIRKQANDAIEQGTARAGSTATPAPAAAKMSVVPRNQADVDAIIKQANEAIAKGKDPLAIRKRLKEMGIEVRE